MQIVNRFGIMVALFFKISSSTLVFVTKKYYDDIGQVEELKKKIHSRGYSGSSNSSGFSVYSPVVHIPL